MFSTKKSDRPIAFVKGKSKKDDEVVYLHEDASINSFESKERLNLYPPPKGKRQVVYVAGSSGSGKSFWTSEYIRSFLRYKPKSSVYLFSALSEDPAFDDLERAKKVHRIKIDAKLIADPISIKDEIEPDSLLIFDDIDTLAKSLLKEVHRIIHAVGEIGRHFAISMVVISHLINGSDRNFTRSIHNESMYTVLFPRGCSKYQLLYFLKNYIGLSTTEGKRVCSVNSRHVMISKNYPPYLQTDKKIFTVDGM
jgi:hypothetical protein